MEPIITIAFAGSGDVDSENVKALLNDWLGTGEEDEEGFPVLDDRVINLVFPLTKSHLSPGLQTVLEWSAYADLPYQAVTDDSSSQKVKNAVDEAEGTFKVANVNHKIISLLEEAEGEKFLVLLWGEEGDEQSEDLLDAAGMRGIPVKDLTAALDELSFEEDSPAQEPEPEPVEDGTGRRRGKQAAVPEPLEPVEEELTDDPHTPLDEKLAKSREDALAAFHKREAIKTSDTQSQIKKGLEFIKERYKDNACEVAEPATSSTPLLDQAFLSVSVQMNFQLPDGREKSLALTRLEEAMMWAAAAEAKQGSANPAPAPVPEQEGPEDAAESAAPRRGRGRPRKDGTPAQTRTEDDLTVAFVANPDGTYVRRGKGRIPVGTKVVELTPTEVRELGLEEE